MNNEKHEGMSWVAERVEESNMVVECEGVRLGDAWEVNKGLVKHIVSQSAAAAGGAGTKEKTRASNQHLQL